MWLLTPIGAATLIAPLALNLQLVHFRRCSKLYTSEFDGHRRANRVDTLRSVDSATEGLRKA